MAETPTQRKGIRVEKPALPDDVELLMAIIERLSTLTRNDRRRILESVNVWFAERDER